MLKKDKDLICINQIEKNEKYSYITLSKKKILNLARDGFINMVIKDGGYRGTYYVYVSELEEYLKMEKDIEENYSLVSEFYKLLTGTYSGIKPLILGLEQTGIIEQLYENP